MSRCVHRWTDKQESGLERFVAFLLGPVRAYHQYMVCEKCGCVWCEERKEMVIQK